MNMQTKPPHTAAEQAIVDSFAEMIGQLPGDAPVTAARDKLLALDFDTVIPGHGPILTKDEVRTFRRNHQTVLDRVQGQIEAGATRDNIASRIDTNDLGWPLAPVRLQDVYDELTAAR